MVSGVGVGRGEEGGLTTHAVAGDADAVAEIDFVERGDV